MGAAAIHSLLASVIAEEITHSQKEYMFPAKKRAAWIPLSQRPSMLPEENHFIPSQPKDEGDDLKLIFSLFLSVLEEKMFLGRMSQEPIDN